MSADLGALARGAVKAAGRPLRDALVRLRWPEAAWATPAGWVAELRSLRWLDDDQFEITGWAYDREVDYTGTTPAVMVWAQLDSSRPRFVPLQTTVQPSPEANQVFNGATTEYDYSGNCFRSVGSVSELAAAGAGRDWSIRIGVAVPGSQVQGPFTKHYSLGPAGYRTSRRCVVGTATPAWSKSGLAITISAPRATVVALDHDATDGSVRIEVDFPGQVRGAELVSAQGRNKLDVSPRTGGVILSGLLTEPSANGPEADTGVWGNPLPPGTTAEQAVPWLQHRVVLDTEAGEQAVLIGDGELVRQHPLLAEAGPGGELRLDSGGPWALVTEVALVGGAEPALQVRGRCRGDLSGAQIFLTNERDTRTGTLTQDGDSFTAVVGFLEAKWELPALPPQIGRISLRATTADGLSLPVRCAEQVIALAPDTVQNQWFRLYWAITPGKVLAPRLEIPFTDDEIGTYNQARLRAQYESGTWPIIDKMYFESFYGRQCGCNPIALREQMVAQHPKVKRVWAVRDFSVAVPAGDEAVADATTAWWRARAECRWLIVNDWLRARFTPREGQTVLQTWHGTMYKKVGLDRGAQLDAEEKEFMLGERKKWDLLLSQNPHSTRVFRESYLSNPTIYEEGYPRNDILVNGSGGHVREVLGIRPDQKVILYAPTWRDDRTELVDYLDVNRLAADLGDDYVVLLRAHTRVIRVGSAAQVRRGVIDVSTYPNTSELLLIADIMITDYSSIMFDYAVTGRPMIFFTPDMDDYRDQLRGVYLDLEEVGPGPMVSTQEEVLTTIRGIDQVAPHFAERYARWQADYTPWDDGGSSVRVLERLLADAPPADPAILS